MTGSAKPAAKPASKPAAETKSKAPAAKPKPPQKADASAKPKSVAELSLQVDRLSETPGHRPGVLLEPVLLEPLQFTSDPGERFEPHHADPIMPQSSPANGLLFALVSASLYGFNIVYARMASFAGASGSAIVVYRVFLMLVLVGIVAAVTRSSLKAARDERGTLLLLGISTAFVGLCYLSSVAYIPVTVAAVVFYTFPILIVLASPFVEGTKLTRPCSASWRLPLSASSWSSGRPSAISTGEAWRSPSAQASRRRPSSSPPRAAARPA